MHRSLKMALLGMVSGIAIIDAADKPTVPPWNAPAWSVESGVLWEAGTGTPFPYRLLQTQLSWRSAEFYGRELGDGSRISLRHRLTLLGALVENAPESRYVAFSASPSLEWWNRDGTRGLFAGAGGGAGFIDSRGIKGGQGQDFTLNWFARGGIEQTVTVNLHLTVAIMFQHLSNGGQTKPNPGVDVVGFMLGCTWIR